MADPIGARKSDEFKAVCTAPSFNKTPVASNTPPLPYSTVHDLANSANPSANVKFNSSPASLLNQTTQPNCKGDDPGSAKGVKSGTVNGEVKPTGASSTVKINGRPVVRDHDPCTMNGGNNPGIYVTCQAPSGGIANGAPTGDTDPPIRPKSPQQESWLTRFWEATKRNVSAAADHPWEAIKGAGKDLANTPSQFGEMLLQGSAYQSAGEMEQAAALQSLFGQDKAAEQLMATAQQLRAGASQIELPKLAMSNGAQAAGGHIFTAATLLAGGAGVIKSGVKGLGALGKTGSAAVEGVEAAKGVSTVGKALEAETALTRAKTPEATMNAGRAMEAGKGGAPFAKSPGDGVKVLEKERLVAGTAAHKADRWRKYQDRGGTKSYDEWSKQYDTNMRNYQVGAAREFEYRNAMGASEGTVKTTLTNRQIDILKADDMYAGQLKTGPVSLTKENVLAIQKDAELVKGGWQVEHILEKGASQPYLDALKAGGIDVHIGPKIP